jgi:hypothetical protein
VGQSVKIDPDAAGHGWSIDADDRAARVDLLTVVLHELGHVYGLGHDATDGGLMAASLGTGERHLPDAPSSDVRTTPVRTEKVGVAETSRTTLNAWLASRPATNITEPVLVSGNDREASDDERNQVMFDLGTVGDLFGITELDIPKFFR